MSIQAYIITYSVLSVIFFAASVYYFILPVPPAPPSEPSPKPEAH